MIGEKFYRLTVVEMITPKRVRVVCDCGIKKEIYVSALRSGKTKSCGCYSIELTRQKGFANKTHGHCRRKEPRTRAYKTWASILRRCYTPSASGYYKYGARGVTVCDEWRNSFECFLNDMGEPPNGKSIDRMNPKAGYSKENCRWATSFEQSRNKTNNKNFTINGITKCLKDWTDETGVCYATALMRLKTGYPIEIAILNQRLPRRNNKG